MFAQHSSLNVMCLPFTCRVEYSTWAGMIVAQYGRFPGSQMGNGVVYNNGVQGGSPPRQSAALDQLQRYYGTGDTCSEPGDFKPGKPSPISSLHSAASRHDIPMFNDRLQYLDMRLSTHDHCTFKPWELAAVTSQSTTRGVHQT